MSNQLQSLDQVNPWVNVPDFVAAVAEVNKAILETFRARDITMPFPQLEVRMLENAASAPG